MPLVVDPAGHELRALRKAANWRGKRVLEIGCGPGRLTLRLASLNPRHIEAIDADAGQLRLARKGLPARFARRIAYHVGSATQLKYPPGTFDIVIFSWAL